MHFLVKKVCGRLSCFVGVKFRDFALFKKNVFFGGVKWGFFKKTHDFGVPENGHFAIFDKNALFLQKMTQKGPLIGKSVLLSALLMGIRRRYSTLVGKNAMFAKKGCFSNSLVFIDIFVNFSLYLGAHSWTTMAHKIDFTKKVKFLTNYSAHKTEKVKKRAYFFIKNAKKIFLKKKAFLHRRACCRIALFDPVRTLALFKNFFCGRLSANWNLQKNNVS